MKCIWPVTVVTFPILDGDALHHPSYGVHISQLIRFARVCSHVETLIVKLLKQGSRYHKLREAFSEFYR